MLGHGKHQKVLEKVMDFFDIERVPTLYSDYTVAPSGAHNQSG